jgi:acetate CoA/acetoacetate CoA-transferase beta subunit
MGGGMDLAQKARKTIILTQHLSKKGEPKLVKECSLPLTAKACADIIITDMGFFIVTPEGLYLSEIAESKTVEDVIKNTGAKIIVSDNLKTIKNL